MKRSLLSTFLCLCLVTAATCLSGCKEGQSLYKGRTVKPPKDNKTPKAPKVPERGCTISAVQSVVQPHLDDVTRCYRKAVWKKPGLAGRLVIEINIDQSGRAKRLGVKEDSLGDHDVTRCVFKVLKTLAYPYPGRGTNVCTVLYPFNFSASAAPAPAKSP